MIHVEHLRKYFGPVLAVNNVSFKLEKTEIVGLLGTSGADKTNIMRILTTYLPASSGVARVAGFDVMTQSMEVRQRVGYLPESIPLYPEMRVEEYLARPGLPREKVLATVVRLLETTLIRIGNEEYARENKSFGLTTMRNRHVAVSGSLVRFHFRGKSGKEHAVDVRDPRLARIVRRCQELPGQELFQYIDDDGARQSIDSADVNAYLRGIAGEEFTAKDFRTWAGTVLAALALAEIAAFSSQRQARRNVVRAVASVARRLGNTPAICRKGYVHPAVIDAYLDGVTLDAFRRRTERAITEDVGGLTRDEAVVLGMLQQRLAHVDDGARAA